MDRIKYKYIIALFLAGIVIRILGTLAKITHAPNANAILVAASILMIIAIVTGIIKVITTKSKKSILNQ